MIQLKIWKEENNLNQSSIFLQNEVIKIHNFGYLKQVSGCLVLVFSAPHLFGNTNCVCNNACDSISRHLYQTAICVGVWRGLHSVIYILRCYSLKRNEFPCVSNVLKVKMYNFTFTLASFAIRVILGQFVSVCHIFCCWYSLTSIDQWRILITGLSMLMNSFLFWSRCYALFPQVQYWFPQDWRLSWYTQFFFMISNDFCFVFIPLLPL